MIAPLKENNNRVSNNTNRAEIFNNHFASIASLDPNMPLPGLPDFQLTANIQLDSIEITELEVKR